MLLQPHPLLVVHWLLPLLSSPLVQPLLFMLMVVVPLQLQLLHVLPMLLPLLFLLLFGYIFPVILILNHGRMQQQAPKIRRRLRLFAK